MNKRIIIAEAAGWRPHPENPLRRGIDIDPKFWTFGGDRYGDKLPQGQVKVAAIPYCVDDIRGDIPELPDYTKDLNLMREAAMAQTPAFRIAYDKEVTKQARALNQFTWELIPSVLANCFITTLNKLKKP